MQSWRTLLVVPFIKYLASFTRLTNSLLYVTRMFEICISRFCFNFALSVLSDHFILELVFFFSPLATMNNNSTLLHDFSVSNSTVSQSKRERVNSTESISGVSTTPSPVVEIKKQKKKKNKSGTHRLNQQLPASEILSKTQTRVSQLSTPLPSVRSMNNNTKTWKNKIHEVNDTIRTQLVAESRRKKYVERQSGIMSQGLLDSNVGLHPETADQVDELIGVFKQFLTLGGDYKESVGDVSSLFKGVLGELRDNAQLFSTTATESIESIVSTVEEKLNSAHDAVSTTTSSFLSIAVLIAAIIWHHTERTNVSFAGVILCTGGAMWCNRSVITGLLSSVKGFLNTAKPHVEGNGVTAQIGLDTVGDVSTLIAGIISAWSLSICPNAKLPMKLFDNLSHMSKVKDSLTNILIAVISTLEKCFNYLRSFVIKTDSVVFLTSGRNEINALAQKISDLETKYFAKELFLTESNYILLIGLNDQLDDMLLKLPRETPQTLRDFMNGKKALLNKLLLPFMSVDFKREGYRQEPVAVMLKGGPGIGKSQVIHCLTAAVCGKTLNDEDFERFKENQKDFVYNRQAENKYWDGYNNQLVTLFDDLGQCTDVAGNPDNEWMNLIRAINSFEYNLHMAALPKKGLSYFNSKFVFCTTNLTDFNPQSIISSEAFTRRCTINVVVRVKAEFCVDPLVDDMSRKIDWLKVKASGMDANLGPHLLEFVDTDSVYGFNELVKRVMSHSKSRQAWHDSAVNSFNSYADWFRHNEDDSSDESTCSVPSVIMPPYPSPDKTGVAINDLTDRLFVVVDERPDQQEIYGILATPAKYLKLLGNITRSSSLKLFRQLDAWCEWLSKYGVVEKALFAMAVGTGFKILLPKLTEFSSYVWSYLFGSDLVFAESAFKDTPSKKTRSVSRVMKIKPQVGDTQFRDHADSILRKNQRTLVMHTPKGKKHFGCITFVFSTICVVPYHFVQEISYRYKEIDPDLDGTDYYLTLDFPDERKFSLVEFLSGIGCESADDELILRDLCLVKLPRNRCPQSPNILSKFAKNAAIAEKNKNVSSTLIIRKLNTYNFHAVSSTLTTDLEVTEGPLEAYTVKTAWNYSSPTRAGDCGGLLMLDKASGHGRRIIGIHVAGNPKCKIGYAAVITYEMIVASLQVFVEDETYDERFSPLELQKAIAQSGTFIELYEGITPTVSEFEGSSSDETDSSDDPFTANKSCYPFTFDRKLYDPSWKTTVGKPHDFVKFNYFGDIQPTLKPPTTTTLQKSPLFDPETSTKSPALLSKKGEIDPWRNAIDVYQRERPAGYDIGYLEHAVKDAVSTLFCGMTEYTPFTFEQAILGLEDCPEFGSINRSTSAGYPHNCRPYSNKKKKAFFGEDSDFDLSNSACLALKRNVVVMVRNISNGIPLNDLLFVDSLKDELRTHDKVKIGKTRLFSGAPVELIIISRMFFGPLMVHVTQTRINNNTAIGVNPYDTEWDLLKRKLEEVYKVISEDNCSTPMGAGDFSAFDASLRSEILEMIFVAIGVHINLKFGTDIFSQILEIGRTMFNSKHVYLNKLYEWTSGIPSGHPLTALMNSLYNMVAFRYCWYAAVHDFTPFKDHVRLCVLGDDNIFNVSEKYRPVFNELTICEYMKELGLTYTTDLKVTAVVPFRPLNELNFLKRKWRYEPLKGVFVAPIDTETLYNMVMWTHDNGDPQLLRERVDQCRREWALHGEEMFNNNFLPMYRKFISFYPEDTNSTMSIDWKQSLSDACSGGYGY